MERISGDRGCGGVSGEMPGLRREGGEDAATAEQGAVQQALRGCVGQACESAAARQVARRFGLPETTVRAIDLRYLERWDAATAQAAAAADGCG